MLIDRIMGVFKLNVATFEEIEHDRNANGQAALVVAAVALLSALGSGFWALVGKRAFVGEFIGTLLWTLVGWVIVSAIIYFVGTTVYKGQATLDEMLRVIGFAYAPQLLGIIPCVGALIGAIWSLIAGFIAVRQGLDLDDMKTFLTILIGFGVYIAGRIALAILMGAFSALF